MRDPSSSADKPIKGNKESKSKLGENVRRARIGVIGKLLSDWNFALVYDFGGTSDGFGSSISGELPGGGTSGVENAYLSYTGLKPFDGKMAIEAGIMDLPWTIDNAMSSNDILFMERASSNVIANNIAAGDFRSAAGARWWNDWIWAGGYVTGPTTGPTRTAQPSNMAPLPASQAKSSAVRTTRCISAPTRSG